LKLQYLTITRQLFYQSEIVLLDNNPVIFGINMIIVDCNLVFLLINPGDKLFLNVFRESEGGHW
jgi:hypothetical protein